MSTTKKKSEKPTFSQPKAENGKPQNPKDTVEQIKKALSNHEPEEQNQIIETVVMLVAEQRHEAYKVAEKVKDRTLKALETFANNNPHIEKYLAQRNEQRNKELAKN